MNGHEADHQPGDRNKIARPSVEDNSLDACQGLSGCRPKSSGDFVTRVSVESDMGGDNQSDADQLFCLFPNRKVQRVPHVLQTSYTFPL